MPIIRYTKFQNTETNNNWNQNHTIIIIEQAIIIIIAENYQLGPGRVREVGGFELHNTARDE